MPISFVHAADLHLDSPFIGIGQLPDEHHHIVDALREATFEAFENVIDLCIQRQADFLLIAGDVYDGADRSLRAQLRFRDGLERLSKQGIHTFVVHGNHDPLDGWSNALQMPEKVHVFKNQLESVAFEKEGVPVVRIHGISYPTRKIDNDFGKEMRREGDEPFQIGLFHCNAEGDPRHDPYAPRSLSDFEAANLDYWALGHIHQRITLRSSGPFIGYPGNTQGRHIGETGPRGCLFVTIDKNNHLSATPEFVPTDQVRWFASGIDIGNLATIDGLLSSIDDQMDVFIEKAQGRSIVARIKIEGSGPLHYELTRAGAIDDLHHRVRESGSERSPFIWIERLVLATRPQIDLESRRHGQDFLGDLLRLIDDARTSPEEIGWLEGVLKDLYQHRNGRKFLNSLDEPLLQELLSEAEIRCAELLTEEE